MRVRSAAQAVMLAGLDEIRVELEIPESFAPDVLIAADEAARGVPGGEHGDRTGERFVTLDPQSSVDLDQAFTIDRAGDDVILHSAIADVGWFVRPGDPLDREAFRRAVTVHLPDRRATLYPTVLSEGAASLLPGSIDRPSCSRSVWLRTDAAGSTTSSGH